MTLLISREVAIQRTSIEDLLAAAANLSGLLPHSSSTQEPEDSSG